MQVMETPFRNCKNSNLEVDKVSFINVKHNFHKGLNHQKKCIFSGTKLSENVNGTKDWVKILNLYFSNGFSLELATKVKLYLKM